MSGRDYASPIGDGYDLTVVLDCGDTIRLRHIEGMRDPQVGDFESCREHSEHLIYDAETGDSIKKRDRRVAEVRHER